MATTADQLRDDLLLRRYLRELRRHGSTQEARDVRTCAECGARREVRIDPDDGWATCRECGALVW